MIREGYVKVQTHPADPHFVIFNYTDKAVYDRMWNGATRTCRGLIVRSNFERPFGEAEVLARPFPKFFNYGEVDAAPIPLDATVKVLDKVDGSLGILYTGPDGLPAIATRGSFASEQALHATEVYRERYHRRWDMKRGYTYLFEIVYPENRIVLDYGAQDDLVLLGAVSPLGSLEAPRSVVYEDEWPGPVSKDFGTMTFAEALAMPPRPNAEGLIVRSVFDQMLKVKQEDYIALHKIIFGLNERAVWERLAKGESVRQICKGLPEEFHPWVTDVGFRLLRKHEAIRADVKGQYRYIHMDPFMRDRKAFAREALKFEHSGLLFMLYDDKDISAQIWDLIRPEHVPFSRSISNMEESAAA